MKELMLGNEALARGAWEAGIKVMSSYPGTPSTEISEYAARYDEIYTEWAPNEKVALEVAAGASLGGARAMSCMKHVGLNVAADPLFTLSYTGVNGACVIIVADDPGMHSSQNEQDSRFYARSAHIPMLEPSDSQEALDFVKLAAELSEEYDTPVLIRMTTRIAHARSLVSTGERGGSELKPYAKDAMKYVMMPGMARRRHLVVEERMTRLQAEHKLYKLRQGSGKRGFIASGAAYQYVCEAFPNSPVFKLDMVYPLPLDAIREFAGQMDELVVVEELEPFVEDALKAAGIPCHGKEITGVQGELGVEALKSRFTGEKKPAVEDVELPQRPPALCPGCPHRAVFHVLKKLKLVVNGDIGCYTLGALNPTAALDSCLCMGASVSMAHGFIKARGDDGKRTVAVIGDSTFLHSGMTGLLNMIYNESHGALIILDNRTTGMTGHQEHPGTGKNLKGGEAPAVDLEALTRALGAGNVVTVDPFELGELERVIKEEMARDVASVIIAKRPCALIEGRSGSNEVLADKCKNCGLCLGFGCPAIERTESGIHINKTLCWGCGLCAKSCKFGAMKIAEGGTV